MTVILLASVAGMFVTLLGTPVAIRLFRSWGWGQRIREDGPHSHLEKMGTPTMGGVVILLGVIVGYLAARPDSKITGAGISLLFVTLGMGLLGFIDDILKVRRQRSLGLSKTAKIVGQAIVAAGFAMLVIGLAKRAGTTDVSFVRDTGLNLGIAFYLWIFLMLAATSNAVNLTDGLDGLASGASILVLAAYVLIAFWQFRHSCSHVPVFHACYAQGVTPSLDTGVVAGAAMGATAGFLWWNAAPARIFMGDTGSLALGGLLAGLAVITSTELLLVILGGLFVLETTSVIVQIIAFRFFHRRVFRMAPIHHHFELLGWPEFTVIVRFWIVSGLAVAAGIGVFYADFLRRGGLG